MNRNQQIALWSGILVIIAIGLFPPWQMDVYDGSTARRFAEFGMQYTGDEEVWYRFAFGEAAGSRRDSSVTNMFDVDNEIRPYSDWTYAPHTVRWEGEIDLVRLLIQWVIATVITIGLVISLKGRKVSVPSSSEADRDKEN